MADSEDHKHISAVNRMEMIHLDTDPDPGGLLTMAVAKTVEQLKGYWEAKGYVIEGDLQLSIEVTATVRKEASDGATR